MAMKESSPPTRKEVRDWEIRSGERLDPAEATSAGHDFAAIAGEREVTLHAQHGGSLGGVKPIERLRWHLITVVVRAERYAGVMLLQFAAGQVPWPVVEDAVRMMDIRRCDLANVAPDAIALTSQSVIAEDLADLLDDAGLPLSTFYPSSRRK